MNVSISELCPMEHQREFVESDEPRLCFEGTGGGGKTWALFAAAILEANKGRAAALVVGCNESWFAAIKHAEAIFRKYNIEHSTNARGVRKAYEWAVGTGTIRFFTVGSTMPKDEQFDFVGIDDSDEFGVHELELMASRLKPNGKLRMTQDPTRRDAILGRRIECRIPPNPFLVAP